MRRDTGHLENEAFTSNPIVSSKQKLRDLKTTDWYSPPSKSATATQSQVEQVRN